MVRRSAPLRAVRACFLHVPASERTAAARAACCLAFSGGLRLGELIGASRRDRCLCWDQIDFITTAAAITGISLRLGLHKAKDSDRVTIPARRPLQLLQPHQGQVTVSGSRFCGVRVFIAWALARVASRPAAATTGPLAVSELAHWLPPSGPVFAHSGGKLVLKVAVVQLLRSACAPSVAPLVHGHSIRITAVTALDRAGVQFSVIRRFGRWKSASACETYLRRAREGLAPLPISGDRIQLQRPDFVLAECLRLDVD